MRKEYLYKVQINEGDLVDSLGACSDRRVYYNEGLLVVWDDIVGLSWDRVYELNMEIDRFIIKD